MPRRNAILRLPIACFLALIATVSSSTAFAQYFANDDRPTMIISSSSTSTAIAAGIVMLTVATAQKNSANLQRYLLENEAAARLAFATGGGAAIEDVAEFFGVPDDRLAAFGELVRRHRTSLSHQAWVDRDARAFWRTVEFAMAFEPRLRDLRTGR